MAAIAILSAVLVTVVSVTSHQGSGLCWCILQSDGPRSVSSKVNHGTQSSLTLSYRTAHLDTGSLRFGHEIVVMQEVVLISMTPDAIRKRREPPTV